MSVFRTRDGSNSYLSPIFGAAFHSKHGALSESQYVFIEKGLLPFFENSPQQLNILEMGFGSGLNILLTYFHQLQWNKAPDIRVDSIEKYPLDWEEAQKLEYCKQLASFSACKSTFETLHKSPWNKEIEVSPHFLLTKMKANILSLKLQAGYYDLIYYDAFAPSAQPELWTEEMCQKLYDSLKHQGLLTTYCAQGQFKRNLTSVGFEVEALPGPPGKREMTRARKS